MFKILPFKNDSTGAAILAQHLPAERINPRESLDRSNYSSDDIVLNWGCGWSHEFRVSANQPAAVCNAVSKTKAFRLFDNWDVPHPACTNSPNVALKWLESGFKYVCSLCSR